MKKKIGLQPGSLIYTGNRPSSESVSISHFIYNAENLDVKKSTFNENFKLNLKANFKHWININGIHNVDLIKRIGSEFNIDSLILEDLLNSSQRPKLEIRNNFIFITLKAFYFFKGVKIDEQISFILFENVLLSFKEISSSIFESVVDRLENAPKLRGKSLGYLTYSLIDCIVDNYYPILDNFGEKISKIEDKIITNPEKEDFYKILSLKKELAKTKKSLLPLREIISKLKDADTREYLEEDIEIYLKDLQDHITLVCENVETLVSNGNELLQLYHSTISTKLNEVMKVLTLISTIFIPITFLTGLYGMNFSYIPELSWHYGYFALLGIMVLICIFTIFYFKKKKWW